MDATHWVIAAVVLFVIGLLAKKGVEVIESKLARGLILSIALVALFLVEHAIFDFGIPAAKEEMHNQIYQCTAATYYNPGCPGYSPPSWQSSSP